MRRRGLLSQGIRFQHLFGATGVHTARPLRRQSRFLQTVHHPGIIPSLPLPQEFLHILPSTETVSIAFRDSILSRCDAPLRNRDYPPQLIAQYNDIFEEQFCGRFDMRNEDRYILRLLQKLRVNCVPVRDEHLAIMGYGVYPTLSPLIHSCQPNCAVTFAGIRANVIALRPIKKGETLTISLFPTCHNALVRDRWLMRLGCGVCHCPRCTVGMCVESQSSGRQIAYARRRSRCSR